MFVKAARERGAAVYTLLPYCCETLGRINVGALIVFPPPKRGIRDDVDSLKHYPVLGKRLSTYDFEKGGAVLSQVRVTSCANYIVSSRNLLQVS